MSDQRLLALAAAAGVAARWVDAGKRPQQVSAESLRAVLGALGLPAQSDAQVKASLEQVRQGAGTTEPPALLTQDAGVPLDLSAYFPADTPFELLNEDGGRLVARLDAAGRLPGFDAPGYHRLAIGERELTLAVAPAQGATAPTLLDRARPRAWGLAVQLYALRRAGDGGIGDTEALERLAREAAGQGADALAISPVHAMFSADPRRFSPYAPSSRCFFNVLHAAPASLLGEPAVRRAIEAEGLEAELARLERLDLLDWPAAGAAKLRLLRRLFAAFARADSPQREDFARFREQAGEGLENHCRFEALQARQLDTGGPGDWHAWPAELRDPHSPAVARFAADHAEQVSFHAFAQWLIARGLARAQRAARDAGMGIGLINDLAVGADGGGSQAWSRQAELLSALSVGAPPDLINLRGQDWGLCAFSPAGLRQHGYRAFIEMLRANMAHAGGLRIDHVMGLQRLWVIPRGAEPRDGAYLCYPLGELLRLLALESWRQRTLVLGEDLGTVPAGFSAALAARGALGMRVLLFEHDTRARFRRPAAWPATAMATTTTHDLPTLSGWWRGRDLEWRERLALYDRPALEAARLARENERHGLRRALARDSGARLGEEADAGAVLDASMTFLGHTPSPLVLVPMEDVLGLEEQANLPSTVDQHPNWRRRWAADSGSLLECPQARQRLRLLARARRQAEEAP